MTVAEIRNEEKAARLEYKNACLIGKYLSGQLFQGTEFIIRRLQNEKANTRQD